MLTEYNVTQLVHRLAISAMSTMQHNLHCNQCSVIVNMENPLQCLVCSLVIGRIFSVSIIVDLELTAFQLNQLFLS